MFGGAALSPVATVATVTCRLSPTPGGPAAIDSMTICATSCELAFNPPRPMVEQGSEGDTGDTGDTVDTVDTSDLRPLAQR